MNPLRVPSTAYLRQRTSAQALLEVSGSLNFLRLQLSCHM